MTTKGKPPFWGLFHAKRLRKVEKSEKGSKKFEILEMFAKVRNLRKC